MMHHCSILCMHAPNTVSNEPLYDAQISGVLPPVSCTIATAAAVVAAVAVVVVQSTAAAVAAVQCMIYCVHNALLSKCQSKWHAQSKYSRPSAHTSACSLRVSVTLTGCLNSPAACKPRLPHGGKCNDKRELASSGSCSEGPHLEIEA
eukprot:14064-Heterococcus_DN1.PRE.1